MNGVAGRGLTVDRISKSYSATVALENVCIHLERGQVHGLLGENGAGKSTLVKILSGVVAPDSGRTALLLFDPTRGVDVGTKEAIYTAIRAFADQGGAVLVYSSELQELVTLADRWIVLYGGRVFAEFEADAIEERGLVAALTGHRAEMVH